MCKNVDLHIVNGRKGEDKFTGSLTCDAKSTIDYAVASAELFPHLTNFIVDTFDHFLSDKHSPVILELRGVDDSKINIPKANGCVKALSRVDGCKLTWYENKKNDFLASLNAICFEDISRAIDQVDRCLS